MSAPRAIAATLGGLLEGLVAPPAALAALPVRAMTLDSRAVRPGDVFVALGGAQRHGLDFAAAALDAGAAAVLFEAPAPAGHPAANDPRALGVPGLRGRLGLVAARLHGRPSEAMPVIGVTGTNGKTSTVQLLAQAIEALGGRAGSIGTLGAGLHGQLVAGERTTPDVLSVHALMAGLRDAGASHVAMEVSSHALDQGRVLGLRFDVAVFTNLTRDHLDYHGDMAAYGAAKAKLFRWPGLRAAVVNLDDAFGRELHAQLPEDVRRIGVSSRGEDAASLHAEDIALGGHGLAFTLVRGGEHAAVRSPLLGRFNVDNLLAVAGALLALGHPLAAVAAVLGGLQPVDGRMSRVGGGAGQPLVVVDYAHTPDALEQALGTLRAHAAGRLDCVFGCGGDRDRGKRPLMGAIAERLADRVIVTDDNPRTEPGDAIVAQILAGLQRPQAARVIRDRAQAIGTALAEAAPGDVVLVAGKGHEAYQEVDGVRTPFDDLAVARRCLEARA